MRFAGEIASLITAVCWTVTALSFENAGKRVGSLPVNIIRLYFAFVFLALYGLLFRGGMPLPTDASAHNWLWLSISGVIGFVIGDLVLFKAFVVIGARLSILIMSLTPAIAAVMGYFFLGETLDNQSLAGMAVTMIGIVMVIAARKKGAGIGAKSVSLFGLLLAFIGAVGQAAGLILSKYGMAGYDAFASTQIRVITGIIGFTAIVGASGAVPRTFAAFKDNRAMMLITLGAFFGPFLGVSFSLIGVKYTSAGVASTIMSLNPVLIIIPSVLIFKEKIYSAEIIGAVLAVAGTAILFLR